MQFLFVVVVVICAASVLASALATDAVRGRLGYGAVILVAGVMSWAVGSQLWGQVQALGEQQKSGSALSKAEATLIGGTNLGVNVIFLDWAKDRIAPNARFYLMLQNGPGSDAAVYQWATYQLFPRVSVASPADADVLIFYKIGPEDAKWDRAAFEQPTQLVPGFGFAQRKAPR